MEKLDNIKSGFQIKNIILLESSFNRTNDIIFYEKCVTESNIGIKVSIKKNEIFVEEEVMLNLKLKDKKDTILSNMKVKMLGIFERIGETVIKDLEEFGRINGAAIIFPYIREHITSLCIKGNIGVIILPPINFVKNVSNKK